MKFKTQPSILSKTEKERSQAILENNDRLVEQAGNHLLKHKDWLMGLKAAMEKVNQ